MPLVIPGINNKKDDEPVSAQGVSANEAKKEAAGKDSDGDKYPQPATAKVEEWANKLVGKKYSEEESSEVCFCKSDLPDEHRVIKPNMMVTKDFHENRLNVHLNENGEVTHVTSG